MELSNENMKRIMKIFSEQMEQGGPKAPPEVRELLKKMEKNFDEYINAVDGFYFSWGYLVGYENGKNETIGNH